jgi:nitrite reductase/ring-hydroxylating ferredoxin subunit
MQPEQGTEGSGWQPGFSERLLAGIAVLMAAGLIMAVGLYLLPPPQLQLAELQPAYRVTREADFPVGTSRVVNWGEQVILVVRTAEQAYAALQGTAPTDGCILTWDPASLRVLSPCTYLVYDLHGNVVRGLSTVPLQGYEVFVRDGVVYVTRS